jgi:hypothetical protein
MHIYVFNHTHPHRKFLLPLCSWSGYGPAQTASNSWICMIKCARCRRKQLWLFPVSLLMEARAGLAAVVENCRERRVVYACRGWDRRDRRTNTTKPVALVRRPGVFNWYNDVTVYAIRERVLAIYHCGDHLLRGCQVHVPQSRVMEPETWRSRK